MGLPLTKTRSGKVCERHPELAGLRRPNYTCVGCDREKSLVANEARRAASGKARRVLYSPDEAAQRIKDRNRERSQRRREGAEYNALQIARKHKWRAENRERHLAVSRAYDAKQLAENLQRRISKNLRHRLSKAMMGKTRGVSAVRDLGMSIAEFRVYIAARFQPDMSWDNYGAWHLDHVKPLVAFDLTDDAQARAACHYSNLQPLWALENQKKWRKGHVIT
jgi:hypothetical protein